MKVYSNILTILFSLFISYICQEAANTATSTTTDTNIATTTTDATSTETNSDTTTTTGTETAANADTSTTEKEYPLDKTSLHCDESKITGFKTGENVYVCVHILPRELRMAFNVTVDNYEVLSISGGYIFAEKDTTNLEQTYVFQFANTSTPYPSVYYNKGKKQVTPLFNVVIKLDKGNITDVVWDNDCWDCAFQGGCQTFENIISFRNSSETYSENVSKFVYYI